MPNHPRFVWLLGAGLFALAQWMPSPAWSDELPPSAYPKAIQAFAQGIEALKKDFPQLQEFSATKHCQSASLTISYEFKTHPPERTGGWTSGVPSPDPDGIWFYIDLHDPDSTLQIDAQPLAGERLCFGKKRVQVLILEGARTKSVAGPIHTILRKLGVTRSGC
jgi:hypothetical protein